MLAPAELPARPGRHKVMAVTQRHRGMPSRLPGRRPVLAVVSLLALVALANGLGSATGLARYPMGARLDARLAPQLPPRLAPPARAAAVTIAEPPATLAASFEQLQARLGARSVGLAYAVPGEGTVTRLGDWKVGPAWSTIKVPLSVAALRQSGPDLTGLVRRAVTVSDNQAALALWRSLGHGGMAAAAVDAVLAQHGDRVTRTQGGVETMDGPFGLTPWALTAQVAFVGNLFCAADRSESDAVVVQQMAHISDGQRWGLGRLEGATFKGGWGPDAAGRYLVRQFGVVTLGGREMAVAVAVEPGGGSFAEGTRGLDTIAEWLRRNVRPTSLACPDA